MQRLFLNIEWLFRQTNTNIVQHVQPDSETLERQLSDYLPISAQFETKFLYESYPSLLGFGIKRGVRFVSLGR